jgi:dihydrofolate reductase
MTQISIIAAIGKNRELGKGNELLWKIPDDLKRFKAITTGHPVIMGRKTFESIGHPLPGRTNIVITRNREWTHDGVKVFNSLETGLKYAKTGPGAEEVFIIGGADIYAQALPLTSKLYVTIIDDTREADVFFPEFETQFTRKVYEETHESNGLAYTWVNLLR